MQEFTQLKRKALDRVFAKMNDRQREAVYHINGPLLILAGAGSGKTTVLINRIANMIYFGNAYNDESVPFDISAEDIEVLRQFADGERDDIETLARLVAVSPVTPWSILAITFTNKAANELKERLCSMLGEDGADVKAATFHSACVRILRREIEALGYEKSFTIYDTNDSVRVIKDCMKTLDISEKMFPPKSVLSAIGRAKDALVTPSAYSLEAGADYRLSQIAKIYYEYQKRLKAASAVDFDDIIMLTVRLFEENPDVLEHYQRLYKYVMVDEYQDTNHAQYKLISLLTREHKNLCVVGDDDQSIYKFRGATIENILSFEKQFDKCAVIRLEQNYRSTQNILSAANEVISNNENRKGKRLWTDLGDGELIEYHSTDNDRSEARFVVDKVLENVEKGGKYSDNAVLYRTNAQSRSLEQAFLKSGVPYKIVGGLKFLDRMEVKDILAYLCVIDNPGDMLRFKRIINTPKRGIGDATVNAIESIASGLGLTPMEVVRHAAEYPMLASKAQALFKFSEMMYKIEDKAAEGLEELIDVILDESGYKEAMVKLGDEGEDRLANIAELKSYIASYESETEEPTLSGFLEDVSLYSDLDAIDGESDFVVLMTVHSAKGLEFENVYIVGFEENIFPSSRSVGEGDIDEERRLAYVAITRAKRRLYLVTAEERSQFGMFQRNPASRFIREIPKKYLKYTGNISVRNADTPKTKSFASGRGMTFNPLAKQPPKPTPAQENSYSAGDRIKHSVFGNGVIVKVTPMSNDAMLEINFDSGITKKVMANFARIKKL